MFPDLCETCELRQSNQPYQTMQDIMPNTTPQQEVQPYGFQPMQMPFQANMMPGGQMTPITQMTPTQMQMPSTQMPQQQITNQQPQPIMQDTAYMQGYLRTQIGRRVKISFLLGTDSYTDRDGTLLEVGVSYVVLLQAETDDLLMCDIFSIKFVRFYY